MTTRLGWLAVLLVMGGARAAGAADCPPGQAVGVDTAGHCCWAGQAWSTSRAMCVGIPACPAGMQASGESCVAMTPPAPPPPATTPPSPAPPPPPTSVYQYQPVAPAPSAPPPTSVYQPVTPAPPTASPPVAPPAPPPPPPNAPVRFEPRDHADDHYRVTAGGKSCTTPCTLELPAGELRVHADAGGRSVDAPLRVPAVPAIVEISHRSRAHLAVGAALLAVGVADVALGFWFALGNSFDGHEAVGGVNIALGGVGAVVGIVDLALTGRARLDVRAADAVGSAR